MLGLDRIFTVVTYPILWSFHMIIFFIYLFIFSNQSVTVVLLTETARPFYYVSHPL